MPKVRGIRTSKEYVANVFLRRVPVMEGRVDIQANSMKITIGGQSFVVGEVKKYLILLRALIFKIHLKLGVEW